MKRQVVGLILLFAASFAVPALAADNHAATVYVYRPSRIAGLASRPSIYVDGTEIARLHNGTYLKFEVTPGHHLLSSARYVEGDQYVEFEPGKQYFFRLNTNMSVIGPPSVKLLEVPQEQAVKEMGKLKPAEVKQAPERQPR